MGTDLNNLAALLRNLGDLAGARPLLERAVAIDEAAHGPSQPTAQANRTDLGSLRPE